MNSRLLAILLLALTSMPAAAAVRTAADSGLVLEEGPAPQLRGMETRYPLRVDRRGIERALATGRPWLLPSTSAGPQAARRVRVKKRADGLTIVTGVVDTTFGPQSVVLTLGDGVAFGHLPQRDGAALRIETKEGRTWLVEGDAPFNPTAVDFLRPPPPTAAQREKRQRQDDMAKADGPRNVDVLVLYTPTLVSVWGSDAAMKARIAHLEAITNQAYVDSDVDQTITVVGTYLVDYVNTDDNIDALELMTEGGSIPLPRDAHRLREVHGADLVALLREFDRANSTSCGVGWLGGYDGQAFVPDWGFSVSADHGFGDDHCGEWTFSHELGHNMGAHHDFETTEGEHGAYPYSRGFRRTLSSTSGFNTIMAYTEPPQTRIGRFSNPRQSLCLGQPCGDAFTADNARGLTEAAPSVAAFLARPAVGSLPTLGIDDLIVVEGDGGQDIARFTLSLSAPAPAPVTISVATMHGTAVMSDYVPATATLTIPAGQSAITYDVRVRGDVAVERDEYFALNITDATGARIADAQGVCTIDNNEAIPQFTLADSEVVEGDAGTSLLTFTASLSAASTGAVTFDIDISEYGIDGARAGYDYTPQAWDNLVIPAGSTSVQFSVEVIGDTEAEADERLRLVASGLTGAEIARDWARGWIRNDDGSGVVPEFNLWDDSARVEGHAGTRTMTFDVSLMGGAAVQETRFDVTIAGSGANAATPGVDVVVPAQTVIIPSGAASAEIYIEIAGDTVDETDETFVVTISNPVGATIGDNQATGTIHDDDGTLPPLVARGDRDVVVMNHSGYFRPLENDAFQAARMYGMTMEITSFSAGGTGQVTDNGFPGARPDTIIYQPPTDFLGEEVISYRICEGELPTRCANGRIVAVVRPSNDILVTADGYAGFSDAGAYRAFDRAEARYDGEYFSTPLVPPRVLEAELAIDATPESAWNGGRQGTATWVQEIPLEPGLSVDWRVIADSDDLEGVPVDLYLGIDTDLGQDADPGEVICTASALWPFGRNRCELPLTQPGSGVVRYWLMAHNRGNADTAVRVDAFEVPMIDSDGTLTITGEGRPDFGKYFTAFRLSWSDPTLLPPDRRAGYVGISMGPDLPAAIGLVPVRVEHTGENPSPTALLSGESLTLSLMPGGAHEQLFIDVPAGASRLTVTTASEANIDLYLSHASAPSSPTIAAAPARSEAIAFATGITGNETIVQNGSPLPPGRWYVTPVNSADVAATLQVRADITAASTPPRPGSYFDPARSGHGLLLYPAGGEWAGLWYTYLQDGTPTWYYLQGLAPTASGIWSGGLYRAMWNGVGHRQTRIGRAIVTPTGPDRFDFTYSLDGETGSEPMVALGRGCPSLGGMPVDASSHWFNPATAGSGHSVQLWSNYEFYAAFVYDGDGRPRFLTSESPSFAGADATLPLWQLIGFCPLCTRNGAPVIQDAGTLRRVFANGTLSRIDVAATFVGEVPGTWNQQDPLQPLGGPGTTQGCEP